MPQRINTKSVIEMFQLNEKFPNVLRSERNVKRLIRFDKTSDQRRSFIVTIVVLNYLFQQ